MNRSSICLLLTALLLSTLPAARAAAPTGNTSASQSWYDIELIVFRYTDPQAGDLETWPADPGTPDWNAATALQTQPAAGSTTTATSTALTPFMSIDAHQLDADWKRLQNSHDYQPLLHVAWMEPLTDHASAASVRIGVPPPAPAAASTPGLAIQPPVTPAAAATPTPTPTPVYGSVQFSQYGPYLHFDVDLVCQGPVAAHIMQVPVATSVTVSAPASVTVPAAAVPLAGATTPAYQWYRMTEDRRIEAGKLNYFDNPMFGVLVLVTPHPAATTATH